MILTLRMLHDIDVDTILPLGYLSWSHSKCMYHVYCFSINGNEADSFNHSTSQVCIVLCTDV